MTFLRCHEWKATWITLVGVIYLVGEKLSG